MMPGKHFKSDICKALVSLSIISQVQAPVPVTWLKSEPVFPKVHVQWGMSEILVKGASGDRSHVVSTADDEKRFR